MPVRIRAGMLSFQEHCESLVVALEASCGFDRALGKETQPRPNLSSQHRGQLQVLVAPVHACQIGS